MLKRLFKEEDGYGTVEMLVILAGVAAIGGVIVTSLNTGVKAAGTTTTDGFKARVTSATTLN